MQEHHEIETHLAFSKELQGLAAGHQQETDQLLKNIEQLRGDLQQLLEENKVLRASNETKKERIAELEQRVADLEKTTFHVDGNYIEKINIDKYLALKPKPKSRARAKMKYLEPVNQLFLWDNNTAISL